ncbi:MAG: YceI family protein [Planctomycetes bacterium]|nr:YceI family protein [Planctomycetota bacterium]
MRRNERCKAAVRRLWYYACVLAGALACGCAGGGAQSGEPVDAHAAGGADVPAEETVASPPLDPERGQLIVFMPRGGSVMARDFRYELSPRLIRAAHAEGIATVQLSGLDNESLPAEVTIRPLCVFQNQYGRSIYQGRTTTPDRLRTFLRVARWVPQEPIPLVRRDVALIERGRARIALAIKITPLAGSPPPGFRAEDFVDRARDAVFTGFERARPVAEAALSRSDRTFHLDFYPYRSPEGKLFVSTALFSQFHCEIPVAENKTEPHEGDFDAAEEVFRRAAAALEMEAYLAMRNPRGGDGFDPVPDTVPVCTWEDYYLPLPARKAETAPAASEAAGAAAGFPSKWQTSGEQFLCFQFAPPLDLYAGEAKSVQAAFDLGADLDLSRLRAEVRVATAQATMGDQVLDGVIAGSAVLAAQEFPEATFRNVSVAADAPRLRLGEEVTLDVEGDFTLKGISRRLTTRAAFEARLDSAGAPRLNVRGSFVVPLKEHFGIDGPEGPSPERDTLHIYYRLSLAAAESAARAGAERGEVQGSADGR